RSGVRIRSSPLVKAGKSRATLAQITPAVYGLAREPRTSTIVSSSTATVRLQVSGQSRGQTLAFSTRMGFLQGVRPLPAERSLADRTRSHPTTRADSSGHFA